MSDLPWFRFFPRDFIGDGKVQMMNATERGIYISLLCHEWTEGPLPDDPDRLARVCGAAPETMEEAWPQVRPCFEATDEGHLVQPRLEEERDRSLDRWQAARKAARSRWDDADGNAVAMRSHSDGNAGGSANQNQKQKEKETTTEGVDDDAGGNATAHSDASDDPSPAVRRVWEHYVRRYGERYSPERADRLKLTAAGRDGKIRGRLREDYSPEELCRAIDGCFGDDWHRERDKHELEYVLRNQSKVEEFLNRADRDGGRSGDGAGGETARDAYERTQAALDALDGGGDDRG